MSRLTSALKTVERYSRLFKNDFLRELGLVSRQAEILLAVRRHPGSSQDDIADELLINKSGVTRHLMAMEEKGLVTRIQSPTDRRVTLVYLTDKAQEMVPSIMEVNRKWSDFITEGLTEQEQQLLLRVLEGVSRRVHENMEGEK